MSEEERESGREGGRERERGREGGRKRELSLMSVEERGS